jgi:hypothetical protein
VRICALDDIAGQWAQFTVHEKLSSGTDGAADVTLRLANKPPVKTVLAPALPATTATTFPTGDVKGHFQYGYYRENEPAPGSTLRPGTGVLHCTALLVSHTGANLPQLP